MTTALDPSASIASIANEPEGCDDPFLVMAGVTKAGTTSLHLYLSQHPQVCASQPKDPFYFLPPEFPLETQIRHGREPLSSYLAIFPNRRPGQTRLESSPLYLLVPGVPQVIKRVLPNTRVLIALREPVARLISFHQMATRFGWLPRDLSFDEYVRQIREQYDAPQASPLLKNPIEEGRYAERLREWQEVFGRDRVLVVWFDELNASPRKVVMDICRFAGIDSEYFASYDFYNVNPARVVRNELAHDAYQAVKEFLRAHLRKGSLPRRVLAKAMLGLEHRLLNDLLTRPPSPGDGADPATRDFLKTFYADDVAALSKLTDRPPPWAQEYRSAP